MKAIEEITFEDAEDADIKEKMQILMVIQQWELCYNMEALYLKNFVKLIY